MVDYRSLKLSCMSRGQLFEDGIFRPEPSRIAKDRELPPDITWKRPKDICQDPQFIASIGATLDLEKGDAESPAFASAASIVAMKPALFKKVVLAGQDFGARYIGIFRFNLWKHGVWHEVIVDDRLPVRGGQLMFCKNRKQPNEFWCALLEKAYAKLHGSYEACDGLNTPDVLVDLTGGVGDIIDMPIKAPKGLFEVMTVLEKMNTIMACTIPTEGSNHGGEQKKGLSRGATYLVSRLLEKTKPDNKVEKYICVRDTRHRNNDSVQQLHWVLEALRDKSNDNQDELCLSYRTWKKQFDHLIMCHLPLEEQCGDTAKRRWYMTSHNGSWVKDTSAGGCGNPPDEGLYWTNPQFRVQLKSGGYVSSGQQQIVMVSLLQRPPPSESEGPQPRRAIGIDVYKVAEKSESQDRSVPYDKTVLERVRSTDNYSDSREVTLRTTLPVGHYVIIPSTYHANESGEFLLRVVTECRAHFWQGDSGEAEVVLSSAHSSPLLGHHNFEKTTEIRLGSPLFGERNLGHHKLEIVTEQNRLVSPTFSDMHQQMNQHMNQSAEHHIQKQQSQSLQHLQQRQVTRTAHTARKHEWSSEDIANHYLVGPVAPVSPDRKSKEQRKEFIMQQMANGNVSESMMRDHNQKKEWIMQQIARNQMAAGGERNQDRKKQWSHEQMISHYMGQSAERNHDTSVDLARLGITDTPQPRVLTDVTPSKASPNVHPGVKASTMTSRSAVRADIIREPKGHVDIVRESKGHTEIIRESKGHTEILREPRGHTEIIRESKGHTEILREPRGHTEIIRESKGHVDIIREPQGQAPVKKMGKRLDAYDIQEVLTSTITKAFANNPVSLETCRNLLLMADEDGVGYLESEVAGHLWTQVAAWEEAYIQVTGDVRRNISAGDLGSLFKLLGLTISSHPLRSLTRRYSNKQQQIAFGDFLSCAATYYSAHTMFRAHRIGQSRNACLTIDEWLEDILR